MGFAYSVQVPPFETPDEVHHYAFARHLAQGNSLPVQTVENHGRWEHEGTQAPLYYLILGRLIAGIDQSDFELVDQVNPYANLGNPLFPGNKNYMLYSAVAYPLSGTVLAVSIGRWLSLLMGIGTLLFCYGIARFAFPGSTGAALAALLTVAAIPQFQFISATVSNDNAVILFGSAVLFWLARLLSLPSERPILWYEWGVLGVLLGAAALSKLQGLGLLGLAAMTILWLAWLRRDFRLLLRAFLPVALPVLLIAGWWYWRNFTLYGDWLGVDQLLSINGMRSDPHTLAQFWGELRGVRYSFWGLFGWFSILMPLFIYRVLDVISLIAVAGVAVTQYSLWRREDSFPKQQTARRVHLLVLVWFAMLVALLLYWLSFATSGQGRLLFPALGAVGVCLVMGIDVWVRRFAWQLRYALVLSVPGGLLIASLYALVVLLPRSYQVLPAVATPPISAESRQVVFGEQIELMAVDVPQGRFVTGDVIEVTLYWRTQSPIAQDYPLFVQLLSPDQQVLGNITSHPGWGRLPTTLWEVDKVYVDQYRLPVDGIIDAQSPVAATVAVGFFDARTQERLPVRTADGEDAKYGVVATLDLLPYAMLSTSAPDLLPADAQFGDQIRLSGYQFPVQMDTAASAGKADVTVLLAWDVVTAPNNDYTAFVHLTDSNGVQVAGHDQPPAQGRFPTSRWQPGDRILSRFPISLDGVAPGVYEVWIGLYADQAGAIRLPVNSSALQIRDQRLLLGTLTIR
ncbi:hypothetical protein GC175_02510 [bacterium]|nr:hypothetical protein [bacterium]